MKVPLSQCSFTFFQLFDIIGEIIQLCSLFYVDISSELNYRSTFNSKTLVFGPIMEIKDVFSKCFFFIVFEEFQASIKININYLCISIIHSLLYLFYQHDRLVLQNVQVRLNVKIFFTENVQLMLHKWQAQAPKNFKSTNQQISQRFVTK